MSTLLADNFSFNFIGDVGAFSEHKIDFCQADSESVHSNGAIIILNDVLIFFIKGTKRPSIDRLAHIEDFLGVSLFKVFNCFDVHWCSLFMFYKCLKIISQRCELGEIF